MRVTLALIADTFREAFARKIFWGLFGLSALMVGFFLFLLRIDLVSGAVEVRNLFTGNRMGTVNPEVFVAQAFGAISAFLYSFGMFLAVFASAGLVPSVLEPGRIELLLSKPLSRPHLLLGRFIGNLLLVGLNNVLLVTGVWLILGWRVKVWEPRFLLTAPITLAAFAVLLTVVVLIGVLWESTALATMIPVALMIISPILAQKDLAVRLLSSDTARSIWRGLYNVLPKIFELGGITRQITLGQPVQSWAPLWSSLAFAAVVLGAGVLIFSKRDF